MSSIHSLTDSARKRASTFSGQLLQPGDAGFEDARKVHNGLVDKHPAMIARSRTVADVVAAIELRKLSNLKLPFVVAVTM